MVLDADLTRSRQQSFRAPPSPSFANLCELWPCLISTFSKMNHLRNENCTVTRREINVLRKRNRETYNRLAHPAYAGCVNHILDNVDTCNIAIFLPMVFRLGINSVFTDSRTLHGVANFLVLFEQKMHRYA